LKQLTQAFETPQQAAPLPLQPGEAGSSLQSVAKEHAPSHLHTHRCTAGSTCGWKERYCGNTFMRPSLSSWTHARLLVTTRSEETPQSAGLNSIWPTLWNIIPKSPQPKHGSCWSKQQKHQRANGSSNKHSKQTAQPTSAHPVGAAAATGNQAQRVGCGRSHHLNGSQDHPNPNQHGSCAGSAQAEMQLLSLLLLLPALWGCRQRTRATGAALCVVARACLHFGSSSHSSPGQTLSVRHKPPGSVVSLSCQAGWERSC